MRVAGIMSGTSLDGIDVAIVDISDEKSRLIKFCAFPYSKKTRAAILAVSNTETHTAAVSRLNFALAEQYARALLKTAEHAQIALKTIQLIGCHGQTVFHERSNTLQLGEAAVLRERTGIPVVSNFRSRDIAAGGHGAPLVPFFDFLSFRDNHRRRVMLNIGGIANITVIPAGASISEVIAFDTGPGNMVIDQLIAASTGNREQYDRDGRIAATGQVNNPLLTELTKDPYYRRKPPKTAGREQYGREFIQRLLDTGLSFPDLIATAAVLTALTIAQAVGGEPGDLIVSGGGVHNRFLMNQLHALLPYMRIATTADYGIPPDAKEAIAFARLAYQTWRRRPSNVPNATGARHPVILGDITL
ncbi:anhydro-N-acetylmuramic acid kinase [Nevskia soli]|uniref:anhydro-N-acetylmuramic acid kinase n=1 Tax=Nevskia soli TaxID=418856 RepID=UPI0015D83305|nr:anhydro-N-acetylmuramic acid kinase [Nevskia soli]